ncbi:response regulator transcription factor [Evansella tamaricis]|uniref:Response regulator transcription factor n=1 Tax=Evansella tamaricis TaxID=2069301 RepID=A0ABS6JI76_9BACI|nr:response regulator transcription factor [Evansella tamaricis]MBU9712567.1 response regulator transcription factor [Evansella tamaricis]
MSSLLKVVIADDHPVIRDGFTVLLSTDKDVEVLGTAKDGTEAVSLVCEMKPDVALLDLYMPEKNGIEALKEIKSTFPFTKVLILSSMVDDDVVIECLSHGASGILLKDWPTEKIIAAIKNSMTNQLVIPESFSSKLIDIWKETNMDSATSALRKKVQEIGIPLNKREEDVLLKVMEGKKNAEIAEELYLSIGTIKNYISSLYKKLGAATRDELMNYLSRHKKEEF